MILCGIEERRNERKMDAKKRMKKKEDIRQRKAYFCEEGENAGGKGEGK